MIETMAVMRCDGCSVLVGSEDPEVDLGGVAYWSAEQAWEAARDEGWSTDGNKHYCPSCWTTKRKIADDAARAVGGGRS